MKNPVALFCVIVSILWSCQGSQPSVPPSQIWSEGCVQLAPDQGDYRLNGMCCEYVLLPGIDLTASSFFVVDGTYHSFTGAGFSSTPITITGSVSPDKNTLILHYSVNSVPAVYSLKPGPARIACDCYCD